MDAAPSFISLDDDTSKILTQAVLDDNVERLAEALRLPIDSNALHDPNAVIDNAAKESYTSLHLVASKGRVSTIRCLLEHGAHVDQLDEDRNGNCTPLHYAARRAQIDAMRILLDARADIHAELADVGTPLKSVLYNIRHGDPQCIVALEMLLEAGLDINEPPLHEYASGTLVSRGCEVFSSHVVPISNFQLQTAAGLGGIGLTQWLVDRGASTDGALGYSAASRNMEMTQWLILHGAVDRDAVALERAAYHSRVDICEGLLPSAMTASPEQLADALVMASRWSRFQAVPLLLDAGIDPNQPDQAGRTALHAVCHARQPDPALIELPLERGADVSAHEEKTQAEVRRLLGQKSKTHI